MRIWLCILLTAIMITGCGSNSDQASPSPQSQQNNQLQNNALNNRFNDGATDNRLNSNNYTDPYNDNNQLDGNGLSSQNNQQQFDKQTYLEQLVTRVPGVKGAHCVIVGDTAIVGIDVDGKLERASVGNIKYTVAEALRKDPHGAGAIVTADIDLNHRINEIGTKIRQGHPVQAFTTELADIIGRIMPQLPEDTIPRSGAQIPPGTTNDTNDTPDSSNGNNNRTTGTTKQQSYKQQPKQHRQQNK